MVTGIKGNKVSHPPSVGAPSAVDAEEHNASNRFLNLPPELACHIFSFLPSLEDVARIQLICKQLAGYSLDVHIIEPLAKATRPLLNASLPDQKNPTPYYKKIETVKRLLHIDPKVSCEKIETCFGAHTTCIDSNSPKKKWRSYVPFPEDYVPGQQQNVKTMTFAISDDILATFELKVAPGDKITIKKVSLTFYNKENRTQNPLDIPSAKAIKRFECFNHTAYIVSKNEMIRITLDNIQCKESERKVVHRGKINLLHHDVLHKGKLYKLEPTKNTLYMFDLSNDTCEPTVLWNYEEDSLDYDGEKLNINSGSLRPCKIYDGSLFFVHPNPNRNLKVLHLIYLDTKTPSKPKIIYTFDKISYQGCLEIAYGLLFLSTKTSIDVIDLDTQKSIRSIQMPSELSCPHQLYKTANDRNVFCSQIADEPFLKLDNDALLFFSSANKNSPDEIFKLKLTNS